MSNASAHASSSAVSTSAPSVQATRGTPNQGAAGSCCVRNLVSILAVFGCFALFVLLVALAYLPKKQGTERGSFDQDGVRTPSERLEKLAELRTNEAAAAHSYAWLDQSTGQIQIPIERAMELTAQRYADKPAQPSPAAAVPQSAPQN